MNPSTGTSWCTDRDDSLFVDISMVHVALIVIEVYCSFFLLIRLSDDDDVLVSCVQLGSAGR